MLSKIFFKCMEYTSYLYMNMQEKEKHPNYLNICHELFPWKILEKHLSALYKLILTVIVTNTGE